MNQCVRQPPGELPIRKDVTIVLRDLPIDMTQKEVDRIVAFLKTLTIEVVAT